jgi:hypothetical protein
MNGQEDGSQVVVTFREIEKVLTGTEARGQIQEAANRDPQAPPEEKATAMAAVGYALNELRRADQAACALVMTTPPHAPSSRLQSLVASGEAAQLTFKPLPTGGLEAKFDTSDWVGWATVAWEKLKHFKPHKMLRPADATPEPMPDEGRVALLGDWGTGLYGAPAVAKTIAADPDPYAMLVHLGDVYYSGTEKEVQGRFLKLWPARSEAVVHRAINSNHEMYSGGEAYFRRTLPAFGQAASYFAHQNAHWMLVGLDVAYRDHDIDDEQAAWLERVLAQAGSRKVVLLSHHQLYSHFESQGRKLWSQPRFGAILRSKRIFAWYWGHEHRCTIFEGRDQNFGLYARCVGHGGMPQSRAKTRDLPRAAEQAYERAEWRRSAAQTKEGNTLPSCVVLEGRNEYVPGEEDKFSPHGYAVLTFDGPTLTEQVLDPAGRVLYENTFAG